ncbi:MAG: hypothetical protein J6W85_00005, partial [Lachnospiraceae bacterium]|nr:hypothetical protein [Lachnospiraceae bacterium]
MKHRKGKRLVIAIVVIAVLAITIKIILFPPVKEIPVTGQYRISSEDYWVTEDKEDPYSKDGSYRQLQVRKWYP